MKEETEKMLVNAIIDLGVTMENLRKEMKEQLAKVNAGIGELRLSYMKLDESVDALRSDLNGKIDSLSVSLNRYAESNNALVKNHETRITRLENRPSVVSEPHAEYKKKKRKK